MKRARGQDGFALLELLVACVVFALGAVTLVTVFEGTRSQETGSEAQEELGHVGQQALEQTLSLGYKAIALTATPATSTDPANPGYYVTAGNPGAYRFDQSAGGAAAEPLDSGDALGFSPAPTPWSHGRFSGQIYRYVTWVCDASVAGGANCPTVKSYKRLTVAVTVDQTHRRTAPILFSTLVTPPNGT